MLSFANAKINLGLFLTHQREDGFHNLETVFYPIKIYDVIELLDTDKTTFVVKGIDIPGSSEDNLCMKVFQFMQQKYHLPTQKIVLLKNIPIGAGLGGGSSDAAFLIKLINDKFDLALSLAQMEDYARMFGSDCTFFIQNKTCLAKGKGDELEEQLNVDLSNHFMVLVKPAVHVSTAEAYSKVKVKQPETSLRELINLPLQDWKKYIFNDFETSVFEKHPQIGQIKQTLYDAGAEFALMSGSGSSVFAIFKEKIDLKEVEKENLVFYNI